MRRCPRRDSAFCNFEGWGGGGGLGAMAEEVRFRACMGLGLGCRF